MKYELIHGQLGSSGELQKRADADHIQGTVLCQVLPKQQLRFEAFPGQEPSAVSGFTENAKLYER